MRGYRACGEGWLWAVQKSKMAARALILCGWRMGGPSRAGLWGEGLFRETGPPTCQPQPKTGMASMEWKDGPIQGSPCRGCSL